MYASLKIVEQGKVTLVASLFYTALREKSLIKSLLCFPVPSGSFFVVFSSLPFLLNGLSLWFLFRGSLFVACIPLVAPFLECSSLTATPEVSR